MATTLLPLRYAVKERSREQSNLTRVSWKRKALFLLTALVGLCPSIARAQTVTGGGASTTASLAALPPSPTVASLGTYGNIPVGYYTGVPNISVPLYALNIKGLSIPINLTYHSTGLLVDQRASNVGLGWSCSALSVIGHTIMGAKGDFDGGYCQEGKLRDLPGNGSYYNTSYVVEPGDGPMNTYAEDVLNKVTDTEPDIYNYSFPGRSGKFVFDQDGVAHCMPYEALKIESIATPGASKGLRITDESGNVFIFGYSTTLGAPDNYRETSFTTQVKAGCGSSAGSGPTGYFLSQIITPYRDTVTYSYRSVVEGYNNQLDLTEYESQGSQGDGSCMPLNPARDCYTRTQHGTQLLTKIAHRGETIEFSYDSDRQDMQGGEMLKGITVKYLGVTQKQFELYHSYFQASGTGTVEMPHLTSQDFLRLRLDSVRQVGLPAHTFSYHSPMEALPPIHSYAQDLWGYYNGRDSNPTLVHRSNNLGANRDSDREAGKRGMLRQITYPTGGTSTLSYEANEVYTPGGLLDQVETLGALGVTSPPTTNSEFDTAQFSIMEVDGRNVSLFYGFVSSNPPASGSLDTFTSGNGLVILSDAAGVEYYRAISGGGNPSSNATAPILKHLPMGNYRIRVTATGGDGIEFSSSLTVQSSKQIRQEGTVAPVGGFRIKEMTHDGRTPFGPPSTTYYRYKNSEGHASGYLLNRPVLTSTKQTNRYGAGNTFITCTYIVRLQSSANQLGLINGSPVGYSAVETLTGPVAGAITHKSVYNYEVIYDEGSTSNEYPFPPPDSYDWRRGRLLRQTDYRSTEMGYVPVRVQENTYQVNLNSPFYQPPGQLPQGAFPNQAIITGHRVHVVASGSHPTDPSGEYNFKIITPYHHYSASVYLAKTQETLYDEQQRAMTTTRLFKYNDQNLLPIEERTSASAGDTLLQYTNYFLGVEGLANEAGNANLAAKQWELAHHILNRPLQTSLIRLRKTGDSQFVRHTLSLRRLVGGISMPHRELLSQGGPGSSFVSGIDPATDSLMYDASYYPLITHQRYDAQGNVLQQALAYDQPVSYLYGSRKKLLLAKAVNARYDQVAYTSFEPLSTGRWQYDSTGTHRMEVVGRTGHWVYRLDGHGSTVRRDRLPAGDYELSLWVQSTIPPVLTLTGGQRIAPLQFVSAAPGGWQQFHTRVRFTALGSVSLDNAPGATTQLLDDLRLYPVGAHLTTYTHEPLVGITSQTDPSGRTTTYEYDALGRLLRTRDEQGRILSQQQYHYAGQ